MTADLTGTWEAMTTAPRDGRLVLVRIRETEQGPAQFDMVRWAPSPRSGTEGWIASDSDPFARVVYAESELSGWMHPPERLPPLRATPAPDIDEADGSGV